MFSNGQKVVCIDDTGLAALVKYGILTSIVKTGKVYVVRGLSPGVGINNEPELAVYLIGIQNPCSSVAPFRERGFNAERFRSLDELKVVTEKEEKEVCYVPCKTIQKS